MFRKFILSLCLLSSSWVFSSSLKLAAAAHETDWIGKLLADEEFTREELCDAIEFSIRNGSLEAVELISAQSSFSWKVKVGAFGRSFLHLAAQSPNPKVFDLILKQLSKYVNYVDANNFTPLHLAAYEGHAYNIQKLIEKGAQKNTLNIFGYTSLGLALEKQHPREIISLLRFDVEPCAIL